MLLGQPYDEAETRIDRPASDTNAETFPRRETLAAAAHTLFNGKYALIRELGSGGMGSVYEAENAWTGRRVAIKTLRPELLESAETVARFLQEGRATARITHPNVLEIFDMGQEDGGTLFIVQELLVGTDLRARLALGPASLFEALDALLPIAGALAEAHAQGIVHRDVKPANIVLARAAISNDPVPKLIDFGIAKVLKGRTAGLSSMTNTLVGELMGTPAYMSPEQITADPTIDGAADVWSLGAVFFEALSGRRAFSGETLQATIRKILSVRADSLLEIAPQVPREIAAIVARMLTPERDERFRDMREVIRALLATSLLSEDALGVQLVRNHRASLPMDRPRTRAPSEWQVTLPCADWKQAHERVASWLSSREIFVRTEDLPAPDSPAEVMIELPDGTTVELSGRVHPAIDRDGILLRFEPGYEIDLLLLEQVAASHVGPSFPAVSARAGQVTGKMSRVLGIDFGTTYTSAAVFAGERAHLVVDEHGRTLHPSMVSFSELGLPTIGWDARRALLTSPSRTVSGVKRLIGRSFTDPLLAGYLASLPYRSSQAPNNTVMLELADPPIPAIQVAALVIEHVRRIAEKQTGESFEEAVLSVPVAFDDAQRDALRRAAQRAGLKVLALIEEPVAAAMACGFGREREDIVAVYDLGGGTFDFSLVKIHGTRTEVLATAGDAWLGGDDFDLLLAQKISDELWQKTRFDLRRRAVEWQKLLFACEHAKRALSFEERAEVIVEGVSNVPRRIDLRETVSRDRFEEICRELLARSMELVTSALVEGGVHPRQVTEVAVTGGMSRAPMVRRALSRLFDRELTPHVNPEEAVCAGAATAAAALAI